MYNYLAELSLLDDYNKGFFHRLLLLPAYSLASSHSTRTLVLGTCRFNATQATRSLISKVVFVAYMICKRAESGRTSKPSESSTRTTSSSACRQLLHQKQSSRLSSGISSM